MDKLTQLRSKLDTIGAKALIITDEINVRYLVEFEVQDASILITPDMAYLLTDFRYIEVATKRLPDTFEAVTPKSRFDFIEEKMNEKGINTLGFEGEKMTYAMHKSFKERFPNRELIDIETTLDDMRLIKTEDEIAKIQKAQDIADNAFSELLKVLTPDMTEIEVAAELEYLMRKLGSEGPSFSTIAVSGDASALPHGEPRNVKLRKGFLTLDFGAKYEGYCSDMTRTVVIGHADEDMKKLYDTVLRAQLSAIEYLKDGRDAGEADAVARRIIDEEYKGAFGHSLGHGVGLLVHESPALTPRAMGKVLVPGNVVTVEPGIYIYGKYGCRIEDMVAIREVGIHNFTHSTKELIEIL
ncbi:MAG: aminopeptidase P family protein [Clostridia bacterium]|nr:aminopeptidase P family protein [Clostridia bacterium]